MDEDNMFIIPAAELTQRWPGSEAENLGKACVR